MIHQNKETHPLFEYELTSSDCEGCGQPVRGSNLHAAISAHSSGYGLILCDTCLAKLIHGLDGFLERKNQAKMMETIVQKRDETY